MTRPTGRQVYVNAKREGCNELNVVPGRERLDRGHRVRSGYTDVPRRVSGGKQQKVAPFCELARESWQDARSLAIKKSHRREPRDDGFRESELG
jgi:hypothetical protein